MNWSMACGKRMQGRIFHGKERPGDLAPAGSSLGGWAGEGFLLGEVPQTNEATQHRLYDV